MRFEGVLVRPKLALSGVIERQSFVAGSIGPFGSAVGVTWACLDQRWCNVGQFPSALGDFTNNFL